MGTELITTASAVTTGVKNVYDITTQLIRNRKQNKLITKGELQYLEVQMTKTIQLARQDARHKLSMSAQRNLEESYSHVAECDPNSPLGQMALELLRSEWQAYLSYSRDFDELTELF
mgnify:CR=1 FL=1